MTSITTSQKRLGLALAVVAVLVVLGGVAAVFPSASNVGYAPEQPIPFSHKLHAGTNKIDCQYCHVNVERSKHASIPALNVCMNCHKVVRTDSPWIQKLTAAYNEGKPVEWIRVHELPDYVYFPHNRHVLKGVSCEACHGDVKNMDRIVQKGDLTMGWCMNCHRGVTTPKDVLAKIREEQAAHPGMTGDTMLLRPTDIAPTNCSTCHD